MSLLATYWLPNTNPIGPASLVPLGIVVSYAIMSWWSGWRTLVLAAPVIFALAAVTSDGFPLAGWRRFPDAEDYVGYYIWSLAASCFALHVARSGSRGALIYGGSMLFPLGWLLAVEAAGRASDLFAVTRDLNVGQIMLGSLFVWGILFAMLMIRASQPYLRARRTALGRCAACGYDMRQSPQRCPECGEPTPAAPTAAR